MGTNLLPNLILKKVSLVDTKKQSAHGEDTFAVLVTPCCIRLMSLYFANGRNDDAEFIEDDPSRTIDVLLEALDRRRGDFRVIYVKVNCTSVYSFHFMNVAE